MLKIKCQNMYFMPFIKQFEKLFTYMKSDASETSGMFILYQFSAGKMQYNSTVNPASSFSV